MENRYIFIQINTSQSDIGSLTVSIINFQKISTDRQNKYCKIYIEGNEQEQKNNLKKEKVGGICLANSRFLHSYSDQYHEELSGGQTYKSVEQNKIQKRTIPAELGHRCKKHLNGDNLFSRACSD